MIACSVPCTPWRRWVFRHGAALILLSWSILVSGGPALAAATESAAQALSRLLEPVSSFQSAFQQTVVSPQGQTLQDVNGVLKAKRPGLFFWQTEAPLAQTLVSDGQTVWIHDPDLEQVTIQPLDQQVASTPALLLSGEVGSIEEAYTVERIAGIGGESAEDFRLLPKAPDALFDTLTLHFVGETLQAMTLSDSFGQKTLLRFVSPERNPPLPDADFRFEIPPGADVIRQTAE